MLSSLNGKSIVSIKDISLEDIESVLELAAEYQVDYPRDLFTGRLMASLFFEPSTRTRLSFESAFLRLGGRVLGSENALEFTSTKKGETIEDTARILDKFVDVIVIRSHKEGWVARAASCSEVPVINAGDGAGEHPTQTLLDLFTIKQRIGRLSGFRIAMVGDLLYGRTVRSLCRALALFDDVVIDLVSPDQLKMRDDVTDYLKERNVAYKEHDNMEEALSQADVVYMTRVQEERFEDRQEYERLKDVYVFDQESLGLMKDNAILLHPLPRVGEIDPKIDGDPRALYFEQVRNGMYVRMALLSLVLGE